MPDNLSSTMTAIAIYYGLPSYLSFGTPVACTTRRARRAARSATTGDALPETPADAALVPAPASEGRVRPSLAEPAHAPRLRHRPPAARRLARRPRSRRRAPGHPPRRSGSIRVSQRYFGAFRDFS